MKANLSSQMRRWRGLIQRMAWSRGTTPARLPAELLRLPLESLDPARPLLNSRSPAWDNSSSKRSRARAIQAEVCYQGAALVARSQGLERGLLEPDYPRLQFAAWRARLRRTLERDLRHELEIPTVLALCMALDPVDWPPPEVVALAGLGLNYSHRGLQLYARLRLAREVGQRLEKLLWRKYPIQAGARARSWLTLAALRWSDADTHGARQCIEHALGEATLAGDWARTLDYAISFLLGPAPVQPPELLIQGGLSSLSWEPDLRACLGYLLATVQGVCKQEPERSSASWSSFMSLRTASHPWLRLVFAELAPSMGVSGLTVEPSACELAP